MGASRLLGCENCVYLTVDKNPHATRCTKRFCTRNDVLLADSIRVDLTSGLKLNGLVDVLIFNPPYVVTPPEEMEGHGISISWAGGRDGRCVIDRFLPMVSTLLSPSGFFFLVAIEENQPLDILKRIADREKSIRGTVCIKKKCDLETLYVLVFWRVTTKVLDSEVS